MYDVFYNILPPSLKDLQLQYIDTDSFVLSYTEGKVSDEHMDLSNLEPPIKTKNKVPGKFKHEMGTNVIEESVALTPKTYSFKDYPNKTEENEIKNWDLFRLFPPSLVGAYYLQPPDARAIFLHNDLLCNGTCSVTGGEHNVLGGTNGKDPRIVTMLIIMNILLH